MFGMDAKYYCPVCKEHHITNLGITGFFRFKDTKVKDIKNGLASLECHNCRQPLLCKLEYIKVREKTEETLEAYVVDNEDLGNTYIKKNGKYIKTEADSKYSKIRRHGIHW